jgi:Spy/CpxP family protein refolding chaperone
MKRSKVILVVLIALFAVGTVAAPALARRGEGRRGHPRGGMMPEFSAEQQEQIEAIHEKYSDERAELVNRGKVLRLELQDLVGDGEPDFDGIEGKLEEISRVRLDLMKLRLRIHKEVRPLLDEDQRTLFDHGLAGLVGRGGRGGQCGMTGRGPGRGVHPRGEMLGRMGRHPMAGRGQMGCPHGMGHGPMGWGSPDDVEDDD